jgi:CRP-like cAMP-binding protein
LYVVLHGQVGLFRKGKRLQTITKGMHFGEMAIVDKSPRSATAIVEHNDTQLLTINRKSFIQLLRKEQGIAVKILWGFLKSMSGRLRDTTEQLIEFLQVEDDQITNKLD